VIDGPTGIDLKPARDEQSRAAFLGGVGRINPIRAGLLCRCPACGEGQLFAGFLKVVDSCEVCGTDFTRLNTGDGAAVFIMQISGGISAFLALGLQIAFAPPLWVLLIVAVPLVLALSFGLMRPGKGLMIALQIRDRNHGAAPHA
jgi:uncharacterized protein (DUF983 family)